MHELESIVDALNTYQRRATYAAVAELTGGSPRSFMSRIARAPRYSWIVAKENGRATGYEESDYDPACWRQVETGSPRPITNGEELREWLRKKRGD